MLNEDRIRKLVFKRYITYELPVIKLGLVRSGRDPVESINLSIHRIWQNAKLFDKTDMLCLSFILFNYFRILEIVLNRD